MLQLITTVVILGATLIDGSGRAPIRHSAVVIKGDSIVAVGRRGRVKVPSDARVIDGRGLVLAPGFIDAHNHSDRGFATDPSAASQVSQGITTVARRFQWPNTSPVSIEFRSHSMYSLLSGTPRSDPP